MKCSNCGGIDLRELTDWYKANCHIQYLISRSLFCYDCQTDDTKKILDNPIKNCDDCEGTDFCPASQKAADAIKMNHGKHKKTSPQKPNWEYGHKPEFGKDGKLTGRTESFRRDQNTGKTESEFHSHFKA